MSLKVKGKEKWKPFWTENKSIKNFGKGKPFPQHSFFSCWNLFAGRKSKNSMFFFVSSQTCVLLVCQIISQQFIWMIAWFTWQTLLRFWVRLIR